MTRQLLVCSRVGHFADDVKTVCADCGRAIVYRPHAPADTVKVCATCAAVAITESTTEPEIRITEDTRRELALYYTPTKGTQ